MAKEITLEELIGKYQVKIKKNKFHKDLSLYYYVSKNPEFSSLTERTWLNDLQIDICKKYKITYPVFLRNLELLTVYSELSGGRE